MASPRIGAKTSQLVMSQCVACTNKIAGSGTCTAFPDGIPDVILLNQRDHREEFRGDGGIRYESEVEWKFKRM